jgi:hypothetical protein
MKNFIKIALLFVLVLLFPVSVIVFVGVLSFVLHCVTDIGFYTISHHPFTWIVSVVVVTIAYICSSADE